MKKRGTPKSIVTDRLRSYGAALKEIGCAGLQKTVQYLNDICESSYLPFRRKERSIQKFKKWVTLQFFTSIHSQIYNHFQSSKTSTKQRKS